MFENDVEKNKEINVSTTYDNDQWYTVHVHTKWFCLNKGLMEKKIHSTSSATDVLIGLEFQFIR